jgi:PAB-dependent poly(A)-specific ribonuclease subunit 2
MEADQGIVSLRHGRYIVSASSSGNMCFWDPSTYKQEFGTKFHSGGVSSFDVSGNYVVSTGYSIRGTSLVADPMIKVFDLRTNKFLSPIPFSAGPSFVRFHPNYAASVLASSQTGSMQISNINDSSQSKYQFLQSSVSGFVTSMEFSQTGEVFGLGDAFGSLQLWSQNRNQRLPKIISNPKVTVYRDLPIETYPDISDEV